MATIYNGGKDFSVPILITGLVPLDDRTVVNTYNDLLDISAFKVKNKDKVATNDSKAYKGMVVFVLETKALYVLIDLDTTKESSWKKLGADTSVSSIDTSQSSNLVFIQKVSAPADTSVRLDVSVKLADSSKAATAIATDQSVEDRLKWVNLD